MPCLLASDYMFFQFYVANNLLETINFKLYLLFIFMRRGKQFLLPIPMENKWGIHFPKCFLHETWRNLDEYLPKTIFNCHYKSITIFIWLAWQHEMSTHVTASVCPIRKWIIKLDKKLSNQEQLGTNLNKIFMLTMLLYNCLMCQMQFNSFNIFKLKKQLK